MSAVTVGTTAVEVEFGRHRRPVIQNLHATNALYFSRDPDVTTSTGVKIGPETSFDSAGRLLSTDSLWLIADGAGTDVRYEAF